MKRLPLAAFLLAACAPAHHHNVVASISDLHLGDPRSILAEDDGRQVLFSAISNAVANGGVDTLVLDGDVLELSLASEEHAYEAAKPVFEGLSKIEGLKRVIVVAGNHDHRLYEELPGEPAEKLGKCFDSGTKLHEVLADSLGHLALTVVYPDWALPVKGGTVHFTHGHYFDPLTTPRFDGTTSWALLEAENAEWYAIITAGGQDRTVRAIYRSIYHWSQHVSGLFDGVFGLSDEDTTVDWTDREESRVSGYVENVLQDRSTIAVVAGHTHQSGGFVGKLPVFGDHELTLYDTGAFVVGHHGHPVKLFLFLVDPHDGEMTLDRIEVPEEVAGHARDRAFSTIP